MIACEHWFDCGIAGCGGCRLGRFGGRPSHGVCGVCANGGELQPATRAPAGAFTAEKLRAQQLPRAGCQPCQRGTRRQSADRADDRDVMAAWHRAVESQSIEDDQEQQ